MEALLWQDEVSTVGKFRTLVSEPLFLISVGAKWKISTLNVDDLYSSKIRVIQSQTQISRLTCVPAPLRSQVRKSYTSLVPCTLELDQETWLVLLVGRAFYSSPLARPWFSEEISLPHFSSFVTISKRSFSNWIKLLEFSKSTSVALCRSWSLAARIRILRLFESLLAWAERDLRLWCRWVFEAISKRASSV